jgi:hypothetical protein
MACMTEDAIKHNWTLEELKSIAKAKNLGQAVLANSLQAVMAKYDSNKKMVVVHLSNGAKCGRPRTSRRLSRLVGCAQ